MTEINSSLLRKNNKTFQPFQKV